MLITTHEYYLFFSFWLFLGFVKSAFALVGWFAGYVADAVLFDNFDRHAAVRLRHAT